MLSVNTEYWFVLQYKVLADCGPPITYDGVLVQHVYSNLANSVERQALERVGQIGRRNASMHCALSSLVGCAPGLGVQAMSASMPSAVRRLRWKSHCQSLSSSWLMLHAAQGCFVEALDPFVFVMAEWTGLSTMAVNRPMRTKTCDNFGEEQVRDDGASASMCDVCESFPAELKTSANPDRKTPVLQIC